MLFKKKTENWFILILSIGLSLIMEGIFSGLYHVCPSTKKFQFDTTFMYSLSLLQIAGLLCINTPPASTTTDQSTEENKSCSIKKNTTFNFLTGEFLLR